MDINGKTGSKKNKYIFLGIPSVYSIIYNVMCGGYICMDLAFESIVEETVYW